MPNHNHRWQSASQKAQHAFGRSEARQCLHAVRDRNLPAVLPQISNASKITVAFMLPYPRGASVVLGLVRPTSRTPRQTNHPDPALRRHMLVQERLRQEGSIA